MCKILENHALKIIISSSKSTPKIRAEKSIKTHRKFNVVRHLKAYIYKLNNKYYLPSAIFLAKIANLLTIFYGPKLQILHSAIFLAKIANFQMTHNYPSPSYTQETYWVVVTTPKLTLHFYSIFLLLSSSYYSMWDFGEYPLENQHILPSPKVSHAMKQTFDTLSTNLLELLLLLVICTNSLNMTIFLINDPHRLAH